MVRDSNTYGATLLVLQPPRCFLGGLEQKRIRPRGRGLQQAKLRRIDACVFRDFSQVAAHQREVMMSISLPDPTYPLQRILVTDMTAKRVTRVGGVCDHPARTQEISRLLDETTLRVLGVKVKALHAAGMIPA